MYKYLHLYCVSKQIRHVLYSYSWLADACFLEAAVGRMLLHFVILTF
jgi:hypothetical protein